MNFSLRCGAADGSERSAMREKAASACGLMIRMIAYLISRVGQSNRATKARLPERRSARV